MNAQTKKLIGIFFIVLIIADLVLFLFSKISATIFWIVIVICAIFAYKVVPNLKVN